MEIPLTQGQVALIDDCDSYAIEQYSWFAHYDGSRDSFVAATTIHASGKPVTVRMHEFLLPTLDGYTVDHVDRNPLNNQRDNLRISNTAQQSLNKGPYKGSKFKGVSYKTANRKYVAQMQGLGKKIHIGLYDDEDSAAKAYDKAVVEFWSQIPDDPISGNYTQFLYLNFPEN